MSNRTFLFCGIIAVAGLATYAASLRNDFVRWDDNSLIFENDIVVNPTLKNIAASFTRFDPELYIPLTFVSFQIESFLFGLNPVVFHLDNLLLHILNAILVLLLLRKLGLKDLPAFLCALLFAVHPINTEVVAWASARKDTLSGFFALSSMLGFLRYRESESRRWYVATFALLLLGMLSKAVVIVVPAAFILIDWLRGHRTSRKDVWEWIPPLALSALFAFVALIGKSGVVSTLNFAQILLISAKSVAFSLRMYFFPGNFSIVYVQEPTITLVRWDFLASVLCVIGIIVIAVVSLRKTKLMAFAGLWWLLFLAPSFATFMKPGGMVFFSDRYVYLAQIGLLLLIGAGLQRLPAIRRIPTILSFLFFFSCLSFLSLKRSLAWANTETLYQSALAAEPRSAVIHHNYGVLLQKRGDLDAAIEQYTQALAIQPTFANARINRAMILHELKNDDEALRELRQALVDEPKSAIAHNNIGIVLLGRNEIGGALTEFENAVRLDPSYVQAHVNLAVTLGKQGKFEEGLREYAIAFDLDPTLREAMPEIAETLERLR